MEHSRQRLALSQERTSQPIRERLQMGARMRENVGAVGVIYPKWSAKSEIISQKRRIISQNRRISLKRKIKSWLSKHMSVSPPLHTYPPGCTENRKRVIRTKAKKFELRDGELFYKQKQKGKVLSTVWN